MDPQASDNSPIEPEKPALQQKDFQTKTNDSIQTLAVAVFIILALGAVVFLYYQNQQLKNMLANYQASPTTIPTSMPSPAASPSATPDTTGWKTYTGKDFNFKYPAGYSVTPVKFVSSPDYASGSSLNVHNATFSAAITESSNFLNLTLSNALGNGPGSSYIQSFLNGKTVQKIPIGGVEGVGVENINAGQSGITLDTIWINNGRIYQATTESDGGAEILTQILSTFEFISASPTPTPISIPVSTSLAVPSGY